MVLPNNTKAKAKAKKREARIAPNYCYGFAVVAFNFER